jgi:Na+/H+ antiporter NhaD/arsenite permease-like protein
MTPTEGAAAAILAVVYAGLALGFLPGVLMNRAAIAVSGAALLVAIGLLDLRQAWDALDAVTLVFLFGVMVLNAQLAQSGFFAAVLARLVRIATSPFAFLVALVFGAGALSAVFLNDTMAIMLTPLVVLAARAYRVRPLPYLLALAAATNIGSVATVNGNPQNIIVGSLSGISYGHFAAELVPVAVIGLVIEIAWLCWLFPEVRSRQPVAHGRPFRYRVHRWLAWKGAIAAAGMLAAFVAGAPYAEAALVTAGVLLISRRVRSERLLARVDWQLLLLFGGLFIVTRGVQELGILDQVEGAARGTPAFVLFTAGLSNVISNVPAVLLLAPLVPAGDDTRWLLLAAVSTLAGNLTLLGSVANLIVAEAARREGEHLGFWAHLKFGAPLTLATTAIAAAWLLR